MNDFERAELRALASLLEDWPTTDKTLSDTPMTWSPSSTPKVENYSIFVHMPVTV